MKKRLFSGKFIAMAVLIASLPLMITCEVENPRALFVYDAMAVSTRNQCVIQPGQRAQAVLPFGILDVLITNNYFLFPRFRNMMQKTLTITGEGVESGQVETNYLQISGAKVWVDLGQLGDDLAKEYNEDPDKTAGLSPDMLTTYAIDGIQNTVVAGAEPESEGAVGVEVIKAELGSKIGELMNKKGENEFGADINVYVMLQAENQAGEIVYSNELAFPIKVCYGCLIVPTASSNITEMPCFPGQDYGVPAPMCPVIAEYPEDCPNYIVY